jgi:hypothetical protein
MAEAVMASCFSSVATVKSITEVGMIRHELDKFSFISFSLLTVELMFLNYVAQCILLNSLP